MEARAESCGCSRTVCESPVCLADCAIVTRRRQSGHLPDWLPTAPGLEAQQRDLTKMRIFGVIYGSNFAMGFGRLFAPFCQTVVM